jgi:hypothetical protein
MDDRHVDGSLELGGYKVREEGYARDAEDGAFVSEKLRRI